MRSVLVVLVLTWGLACDSVPRVPRTPSPSISSEVEAEVENKRVATAKPVSPDTDDVPRPAEEPPSEVNGTEMGASRGRCDLLDSFL